jgi:hypothetical protein
MASTHQKQPDAKVAVSSAPYTTAVSGVAFVCTSGALEVLGVQAAKAAARANIDNIFFINIIL